MLVEAGQVLCSCRTGNIGTLQFGFQELLLGPNTYHHILPFWFLFSIFQEYLVSSGVMSCFKRRVNLVLNQKGQ
ncbi:2-acylglycerol O-acyltransferase 1 [Arapaima gigas]